MRSFRSKPIGWRGESYRHYLASKGIKTIKYMKAPKGAKYDLYGVDSKGRRVRLYDKQYKQAADKKKFNRIGRLSKRIDVIEGKVKKDLDSNDEARAMYVILKTGLRPGSDKDTKGDVQAYGVTTLKDSHVKVNGNITRFKFIGKKGVKIDKRVKDPVVAKIIKHQKALPGDEVFPDATAGSVRSYVKKFGNYKTKDLRTVYANRVAERLVKKGLSKKEVVKKVSDELQNTPAVTEGSYISHGVFK